MYIEPTDILCPLLKKRMKEFNNCNSLPELYLTKGCVLTMEMFSLFQLKGKSRFSTYTHLEIKSKSGVNPEGGLSLGY